MEPVSGRKRWSARSLRAGVDRYFSSISRTVEATERVETGPKTFEERPILSDAGEPIRYREYVVAPTLWGLCESLGIAPAEWERLCDRSLHPELKAAVFSLEMPAEQLAMRMLCTEARVNMQNVRRGQIADDEWERLCDRSLHPELQEAVQRASGLMREWREQTLLTRKDVRGLIYHMQNRLGGLDLPREGEEPPLSLREKGELLFPDADEEGD